MAQQTCPYRYQRLCFFGALKERGNLKREISTYTYLIFGFYFLNHFLFLKPQLWDMPWSYSWLGQPYSWLGQSYSWLGQSYSWLGHSYSQLGQFKFHLK